MNMMQLTPQEMHLCITYIQHLLESFVKFDYTYLMLEEASIKFASVRFSLMSILVSQTADAAQQFVHASWLFCGSICSPKFQDRRFQPLCNIYSVASRADWFVCPKSATAVTLDRSKINIKSELKLGAISLDIKAPAQSQDTLLAAWFPLNNKNIFDGYSQMK